MKLITNILTGVISLPLSGATLTKKSASGEYLHMKLEPDENLELIFGGPVELHLADSGKTLRGYLISKSGRNAVIQLTPPAKDSLKKGTRMRIQRTEGGFHSTPLPPVSSMPSWSLLCPLSLCMAGLSEARHDWLLRLQKQNEYQEIQGDQRNFRQRGLSANLHSTFSDPAVPITFFLEFSYSHLRGPAKLNDEEGEGSTRQDSGSFGVVMPGISGTKVSVKLTHETISYYGDVYLKSRHNFQQNMTSLAIKKTMPIGTLGMTLESPFSQKSQEGTEIVYHQRSLWLGLLFWKKMRKRHHFFISLTAEPNYSLNGQNNSWKNAVRIQGAVRSKLVKSISLELGLMRRTSRYKTTDPGLRGDKLATTRLTVNISKPLAGTGLVGLFLQAMGGDGRGSDQQGNFFQASQLREELGVSVSFSL